MSRTDRYKKIRGPYNNDTLTSILKERNLYNPNHDLSNIKCDRIKNYVTIIDEYGFEHRKWLPIYIKTGKLDVQTALDKNGLGIIEMRIKRPDRITDDFSKVVYKGDKEKVEIICKHHGGFLVTPHNYKQGMSCPKCARESHRKKLRKIPEELTELSKKIRTIISRKYRNKGYTKKSKTQEILGCTWQEFRNHLEDNPYGFKIGDENLDLDHIIPISSAITEEGLYRLNHYTNFQLLPSFYNRHVKKAETFQPKRLENWIIGNIYKHDE